MLKKIILLGFLLRVIFIFNSNHLFYPDELFQAFEQSYRLVHGYGLIPWDYQYQIRSYVLPLILTPPLLLSSNPNLYIPIIKIYTSLFSIILIPTAYYLVLHFTKKKNIANYAAFIIATWYELIYFAARPYTETFATYLFALAALLAIKKPKLSLLFYTIVSFASILRPQYFLLFLFALFLKKNYKHALFGTLISLLIFGTIDLIFYHSFLIHLVNNLKFSFLSGVSAVFGTQPLSFYITRLITTSFFMALIPLIKLKKISFIYILILLIHSFIPHKEYRFIFILIPTWITLSIISINPKHLKLATIILTLISIIGILGKLPYQTHVYAQKPLFKDPALTLLTKIYSDQEACGVYDNTRQWTYTGGYFYLGKKLPLYDIDSKPQEKYYNYLITVIPQKDPNFTLITSLPSYTVYFSGTARQIPSYMLYKRIGECQKDPDYTYIRSFPFIESKLK